MNDGKIHCIEFVRIRSYSGPPFPAFGLNMERYGVRIQSESGKMRTRITLNTRTFHAVNTRIFHAVNIRTFHAVIPPGSWLTSLLVNWTCHILSKKLIFKSAEPIEAPNTTGTIETKQNEVHNQYLPNL